MTSVKHVLIDVINIDAEAVNKILNTIEEVCGKVDKIAGLKNIEIGMYMCQNGFVHVQQHGKLLLIDLYDSEDVFERILRCLPREYVMIRLVERGFQE